jgi:hypothetical protein
MTMAKTEDTPGYLALRKRGHDHKTALRLLGLARNRPNSEELAAWGLRGYVLYEETGMDKL